ncbi:hypothetical protein BB560_003257 [Smittium megazygosporum]|uniref:BZIP domain-containing protein n=1 Tax=Smittium megazygosporum TaxID=133381 RepID=A0A2T9ZCJ6_9FUNG|nr:hypothetical protein BB560_005764 [Smittium megazygosporum]PVV02295.1 hypothetical protein BB560_003257 [Smittium megazygosporum]
MSDSSDSDPSLGDKRNQGFDDSSLKPVKKVGRKPVNTEATTKRAAQNRAAQRAFRDRKQRYVTDLEQEVSSLKASKSVMTQEVKKLREQIKSLKQENEYYKKAINHSSITSSFDFKVPSNDTKAPKDPILEEIQNIVPVENYLFAPFKFTPPSDATISLTPPNQDMSPNTQFNDLLNLSSQVSSPKDLFTLESKADSGINKNKDGDPSFTNILSSVLSIQNNPSLNADVLLNTSPESLTTFHPTSSGSSTVNSLDSSKPFEKPSLSDLSADLASDPLFNNTLTSDLYSNPLSLHELFGNTLDSSISTLVDPSMFFSASSPNTTVENGNSPEQSLSNIIVHNHSSSQFLSSDLASVFTPNSSFSAMDTNSSFQGATQLRDPAQSLSKSSTFHSSSLDSSILTYPTMTNSPDTVSNLGRQSCEEKEAGLKSEELDELCTLLKVNAKCSHELRVFCSEWENLKSETSQSLVSNSIKASETINYTI